MSDYDQASSQSSYQPRLKPDRGTVILVLGILGIVVCIICGIVAWVMANTDLREMDEGIMDSIGRSNTQTGRILGIVSVILNGVGIIVGIIMIIFFTANMPEMMNRY